MSDPIQSISQGNYILQGTVATSAGIVGDGSSQNPLRADETVLWNTITQQVTATTDFDLTESFLNFEYIKVFYQNSFGAAAAFMNSVEALVPDETSVLEIPTVFPCGYDSSNQSFDRNTFSFTSANPAKVTVYAAGSRVNVSTTGSTLGCVNAASRGVRLLRIVGRNRKSNA